MVFLSYLELKMKIVVEIISGCQKVCDFLVLLVCQVSERGLWIDQITPPFSKEILKK